ncbi:MAG: hypothetical protein REI64_00295 [Pedobacter sp.]|uniref:hypothetical protein n=1 Tax=Pedobacter sp. TaxID=1411316 RepID=UPI0028094BBC|nr:hypothetical protein [Pedobacter sp.]MDQ8003200.1 hypothetical protein [Pedobacter sp.]
MRQIFLSLCLVCTFVLCKAQNNDQKIDYQYLRSNELYVAYTLSLDTTNNNVVFEFVVNKNIKEVKKIVIIAGDGETELAFKEDTFKPNIDDKKIKSFRLLTDFGSYPSKNDCNATIRFVVSRKIFFDLPLNYCILKKHLN